MRRKTALLPGGDLASRLKGLLAPTVFRENAIYRTDTPDAYGIAAFHYVMQST